MHCKRVQAGGLPKEGFVVWSRTQGVQEILKIWDVLTPAGLNWGRGWDTWSRALESCFA